MDDVVAVRVERQNASALSFLTWGRIFDATEDAELVAAIENALPAFGIVDHEGITICDTLTEVASEPYFYEGLLKFAAALRSSNQDHELWRLSKVERVRAGKDIFLLGRSVR